MEDISLAEYMNDLVGITQAELETNFKPELEDLAEKFDMEFKETLEDYQRFCPNDKGFEYPYQYHSL